jgi:hypothetical protein
LKDPEYLKQISPLFNVKLMMEVYLDLDYEQMMKKHKEIQKFEKKNLKTTNSIFKMGSIIDIDIMDVEEEEIELSPSLTEVDSHFKVKLVISELKHTNNGRNLVQTLSPILDFFNLQSEVIFLF